VRIALVRDRDRRAARALVDPLATMGGRGAYLCRGTGPDQPAAECLARATHRGGIARALRAPKGTQPEGLDR
jgi:hypothetical protein